MPTLPDEPVPTTIVAAGAGTALSQVPSPEAVVAKAPEPSVEEPRRPGRVGQTYWFVLVGCVLAASLVGCYFAILYGHWHPISFSSHYPKT